MLPRLNITSEKLNAKTSSSHITLICMCLNKNFKDFNVTLNMTILYINASVDNDYKTTIFKDFHNTVHLTSFYEFFDSSIARN